MRAQLDAGAKFQPAKIASHFLSQLDAIGQPDSLRLSGPFIVVEIYKHPLRAKLLPRHGDVVLALDMFVCCWFLLTQLNQD